VQSVVARLDAWENVLTGVAQSRGGNDFRWAASGTVTDAQLDDIYRASGIARRIVSAMPDDAFREPFKVQTGDSALDDALGLHADELRVRERCLDAWRWARLFGGGAVLLGVDDGRAMEQPIDLASIKHVHYIAALDSRYVSPFEWETNILSPNFGQPKHYMVTRLGGQSADVVRVHASRIVRFDGEPSTITQQARQNWWGESSLRLALTHLQQFEGAYAATGELLQQSSVGVFRIKNLMAMIAADKRDLFKKRFELMDLAKSVARSILIDADGEDYQRVESGTLSGMSDVLLRFAGLLSAATGIPVTILMGQAPAGLNATGDADMRQWYDRIRALQSTVLRRKLTRILRVICSAQDGPTQGRIPAKLGVEFPPLWQLTDAEKADVRAKQATADVAYITAGVVTPEEVATSRFRDTGWSAETTISLASRQALMQADQSAAELVAPPSAPPVDPSASRSSFGGPGTDSPAGAVGTP